MLSARARDLVGWAGSGLSLIAIVFVMVKLKEYSGDLDVSLIKHLLRPLVALSIVYGVANLIMVLSWKNILQHLGVSVSTRWATGVYGTSQLAKYIPGNIFHFLSRQAMGAEAGVPAMPLVKSTLWELGVFAIAGSLAILLVLPNLYQDQCSGLSIVLFVLVSVIAMWISQRWFSRWVAHALGWDILFLCVSGLVFVAVLSLFTTVPATAVILIGGSYVLAWLAGLVTPGAPAGVGIREVVLLALLHPLVSEADLLPAVLAGRVVTVVGDFLFYLIALSSKQLKALSK